MSFSKRITFISRKKFPTQRIQQYFALEYQEEYDIRLFPSYADAEMSFFDPDYSLSLLIIDFRETSLFKDIQNLKSDEMFRFLPVLGIVPQVNPVTLSAIINCGCESYLEESHIKTSLIEYMHVILFRADHQDQMSLQVSQLQEKSIRNFILLDIIKNYIPRTIWNKAEDFAQKQRLELNSEETELVICFADICQFSTLSQYKQPKDVVEMLNTVFEVATRHVFYHNGDIDKFIGDAFLAIFTEQGSAIKAIFGIQKELKELNQANQEVGEEIVQFRIGMHIGKIIRGNVGGNERFDNTLIGDTTNAASRLEGKSPHGGFVISEAMRQRLELDIPNEYRMASKLKGREGEEVYYSMFDFLEANPDVIPKLLEEAENAQKLKGMRIQSLYKHLTTNNEEYII